MWHIVFSYEVYVYSILLYVVVYIVLLLNNMCDMIVAHVLPLFIPYTVYQPFGVVFLTNRQGLSAGQLNSELNLAIKLNLLR